ncbi:S9 family peptidase [Flavobacterium aurantiibacter]|uniref:Proline-specific endopeptidase n=1 Tax=Flavobacterium aurantiibacter TaxID=2023067 RepID=A0A255ZZ84_9FLAO|nr:S9 family peptidase [Flavobacterium aurantiibacter]OYQ46857.1 oligopeptidase B [Flavobacterium aurantiibacter]
MSQPPVAKEIPFTLEKHKDVRIDPYYWLNDRENPEVIDYLNKENAYFENETAHTKDFQVRLFEEMKSRIKEDDQSVPYKFNGYYYITRTEKGKNYPIYARKKESLTAAEEILFDCNQMAEGYSYFSLSGVSISPDNKYAAFCLDVVGRRIYTLRIKNLETGEILADEIKNVNPEVVWAADSKTLFYTTKDSVTLRSDKIWKYVRGSQTDSAALIYEEKDETFDVSIEKSKSKEFIYIISSSTLTTEYRLLRADNPDGKFKIFQKRKRGVEYSISHFNNIFYILTNKDKATNFKLMMCSVDETGSNYWKEFIAHRNNVLLEGIDVFKDFLVISERSNGLTQIRVLGQTKKADYYLPFKSETYSAYTTTNIDFDTPLLRYSYQSMLTPPSVIEFNMETKQSTVLKEQEVQGGNFDKNNYIEERVWATATDGTQVPISMVYAKNLKKDGSNPTLLYAYGSYGVTLDPYFSTVRLSLLDRGFIYAIAHIRGGEDLGREWYENGKLLKKKNTFTDFIACSNFLITQKYTSPQHLYAEGGSAGGLLMGAIVNMAGELYNGVIAQVPFVDVVTTMLDDSIPLTTGEYDEWGNPNKKKYYDYMKSYSPYDNVSAKAYPNMLITTGLHDSQVQYFEPAKWVAKLRKLKTNQNKLYFYTNMDAGHGGASGRYEALKEVAREFAFLLDLEGIRN